MPKHRLVISVTGAAVEDVFTDAPDLEVILCDWDIEGLTKDDLRDLVRFKVQGVVQYALVGQLATVALPTSPDSLVGTALKAAGLDREPAQVPESLSGRELSTILAALRCFQDDLREAGEVLSSMDHFQVHEPLTAVEIDALCERLNGLSPQQA